MDNEMDQANERPAARPKQAQNALTDWLDAVNDALAPVSAAIFIGLGSNSFCLGLGSYFDLTFIGSKLDKLSR